MGAKSLEAYCDILQPLGRCPSYLPQFIIQLIHSFIIYANSDVGRVIPQDPPKKHVYPFIPEYAPHISNAFMTAKKMRLL